MSSELLKPLPEWIPFHHAGNDGSAKSTGVACWRVRELRLNHNNPCLGIFPLKPVRVRLKGFLLSWSKNTVPTLTKYPR